MTDVNKKTILVKKKDGTKVRMTLEEFRIYKSGLGGATPVENIQTEETKKEEVVAIPKLAVENNEKDLKNINKSVFAEVAKNEPAPVKVAPKENFPIVVEHHELATTAPVKNIFVDEAAAKVKAQTRPWVAGDHVSPLEDKEDIRRYPGNSNLSEHRDNALQNVLSKIDFSVNDDLEIRLELLVQSYLKGVRSEEQIHDYSVRPIEKGGLGFNAEQVDKLLEVMQGSQGPAQAKKKDRNLIPNKFDTIEAKPLSPVVSQRVRKPMAGKVTLHDVSVSDKKVELPEIQEEHGSMGPIDELVGMTLLDFRRLSDDPAFAAETVLEKLLNLKEESYSVYLQGIKAFYSSPLYTDYKRIIENTVNEKESLAAAVEGGGDAMSYDEFLSLVETLKNLDY